MNKNLFNISYFGKYTNNLVSMNLRTLNIQPLIYN